MKKDLIKFSQSTLDFLIKANKQKSPDWLEKNQEEYKRVVKKPFIHLAETIKAAIQPLALDYHFPSKGLGRIKRPDFKVRPGEAIYKDWLSMIATKPSQYRFEANPHLFFGIFPNEEAKIIVAAGLWQASSKQAQAIRQAIFENSQPFHALFRSNAFKKRFKNNCWMTEKLKKAPTSLSKLHPDADWLMLKKFVVIKEYSIKTFCSPKFPQEVIKDYKQALLLNRLLEKALKYDWPPK